MPANLQQPKFVLIWQDAHRTPRQRPYTGTYKVIKTGMKTFKIDMGGTVNQLKLAHMDLANPILVALPRECLIFKAYEGLGTMKALQP